MNNRLGRRLIFGLLWIKASSSPKSKMSVAARRHLYLHNQPKLGNFTTTMRICSFQEMLKEYGITELETDDSDSRNEILSNYKCSIIIEGGFMEFDSLNKWIKTNIGPEPIEWLFYGKTGYNFGFTEYFFTDKLHATTVGTVVPNIHTVYPSSYPPNQTDKSNGYDEFIAYDPADKNAIVVKL